jgi:CO/xanthine dehydrogenase Mo-binding subunit
LVIGQHEGAAAMGIGYALLEDLPLLADGGGSGRWNLDRYSVALARHVPLGQLDLELLGSEDETAKGIAEAVLCPIVPAIVNAIAHATGRRFRSLPVTAAKIREALT